MEDKNEILDELQRVSSCLAKMDKPSKGEIPEGYFQSFESNLMDKIKAGNFEEEVEEEIVEEEVVEKKFLSKELELKVPKEIKINFRKWAIAASIALVLGLGIKFIPFSGSTTDDCVGLACLEQDVLEYYMEENVEDFEDLIWDEVEVEDIYETSIDEEIMLDEIDESLLIDEL